MTPTIEVMLNLSSRFSLISMADVGMVEVSIQYLSFFMVYRSRLILIVEKISTVDTRTTLVAA
jgi:hypothetical protein